MPDIATTAVTPLFAAASEQQGAGDTLRIALLVSIVGAALLAWFLLRGYGNGGEDPAETKETKETNETEKAAKSPAAAAARTENGPGDANA
ncbi:hypothetical protein [Streptomyces sp. NPDC127114]|uniref:hypothetical protein n=1 Tax=Streptomyces sp. NPDC127114 TaxID=3345366 RepID=UPI0036424F42